ncbi:MAG TPA: protein kinase [Thermoanaerobaculia bacterium]|nr:protein kinase [Thermoanaerobaculia bacterium]
MTLAAGTRLGPYEILAPLGAGGMGEVYRARDRKLDRDVAIKVLPSQLTANADALARFEREAKAVAALSHPNILAIFDFGTENGVSYAAMELLEGETLRGKIDGSAVTQKQAVEWALQVAKGLSAAHSKGVVHRDLKPDNVFVTNHGHVKILDFGLAKRVDAAPAAEQTSAPTGTGGGHTEPGTVMGTLGYMSPEQVRGLPVDHRSDIFSFGAILYELLSGKKAFKRDTASDTMAAIMRDEPPELTQSGRNVSPSLDHVVRHCLEKERENRFQSAKDVAFALSEASGSSTAATWERPAARGGIGKWIAAAAVVAAVIVGILVAGRSPRAAPAPNGPRRVAVLPFENLGAPEDEYFADGISDEVRGKLTTVPGLEVIARGSSTPYKKTTKTPKQIATELNASYLLTATVRWEKAGDKSRVHVTPELVDVTKPDAPTSKWQQPFDANLTDVFQVQSDIAAKVVQSLGVALAAKEEKRLEERPTQNLAAYDAYLKGEELSNAMGAVDPASIPRAIERYEQAVALDPGFVAAWARLSQAASTMAYDVSPTPEITKKALDAAQKALSLGPERSEPYVALGVYYDEVESNFREALAHYAKARRYANSAEVLTLLASSEESLGAWAAAGEHLAEAERLDPRSILTLRRRGVWLIWNRRYAEAREVIQRALALAPTSPTLLEYEAMTHLGEGDLAKARAVISPLPAGADLAAVVSLFAQGWDLGWVLDPAQRKALLRLTAEDFGDEAAWAVCLAQAAALDGDREAVSRYAEIARRLCAERTRLNPQDDQGHAILGIALAYLGRKDEAIREGRQAVAVRPTSKDAYAGPYNQQLLARIYAAVGEPDAAVDQLEAVLKVPFYMSKAWLRIDPNYDSLRSNPRFQKLVADAR